MSYPQRNEKHLDFYTVNNDFLGERNVTDSYELVQYHNNSTVRIWCNEQVTDFETHWHAALEIIMPIENFYDVTANQISYHLQPKDILIIPSGEMHKLSAPDSGRRFIYLFDPFIMKLKGFSSIQSILAHPLLITRVTFPKIYNELYSILNRMQYEYFSESEYAELSIYSLLLNFFASLGYDHVNSINPFPNTRSNKKKEYIKKFNELLEYIDTHYMDELKLDDLAKMIGFSKYHFSRLFQQYTNFSFVGYVNYRRLKVAEELLMQPDLAVTDVAIQSGFNSISTFNRIFRKEKNCTPSEYRAMNMTISF